MLLRALLILIGYIVACAGFALVLVSFVFTPVELWSSGGDRWSMASFQLLASTILVAFFSAIPVLPAAAIAEWRGIRSWQYYVLVALLFAGAGFVAQYLSEQEGALSIVNRYALVAFATGAIVAGTLYWLIAGRGAGTRRSGGGTGDATPATAAVAGPAS